jgi:hypothetical protein
MDGPGRKGGCMDGPGRKGGCMDGHVQCTFRVEGQRVGAVFDLPATLTAAQVAEVMTTDASPALGSGRAVNIQMNGWRPFVGLDGSGRPFSKALGELAHNREVTYEITALWRCPRALQQTLEEAEATFSSAIDPHGCKNNNRLPGRPK